MYTDKLLSLFYRGGAGSSNVATTNKSLAAHNAINVAGAQSSPRSIPASGRAQNGGAADGGAVPQSLPSTLGGDSRQVESLKKEVSALRHELNRCRDTISKMQERERVLRDRLSEQVQKQFEKSTTHFEDLNLGDNRPTMLIRRYGNLYSQTRLDALDALDELPDMAEFDDLKGKLLFSVVVLSFRSAQLSHHKLRTDLRRLLSIPEDPSEPAGDPLARDIEENIKVFLKKKVDKYDLSHNIQEVSEQVYATLYDYPSLRECDGLQFYVEECVRLAWALTVQNPPIVLEYDVRIFSPEHHTRFCTSDPDSDQIQNVLWPSLLEGENGPCLYKGVVVT